MTDDTVPDADSRAPTVLPSEESPDRGLHDHSARRIGHGDHVGRYVIEHRIGKGGMGVVYLARDPDLDRKLAIKLLRPELAGGRQRLLREGQTIARLAHPNVVTVFDVGALGDDLFIAMEYVPGTTLRGWLEARPRSWPEIVERFLAAGRGLAAAHRANVIHRDFKPDNVLLSDDGRVVVSDFGLASSDGGAARARATTAARAIDATRTAGPVGTPAFMAPEQFLEAPLDGRADQFSFCVALWQALFGERPFTGESSAVSFEEMASLVLAGVIRPPPRDRKVPARIIKALRRGLAVTPSARFASMDELLVALAPGDRRPLYLAAAIGAVGVGIAVALVRGGGGGGHPRCDLGDARLATIWSERARAGYHGPTEDVAWFDELARRWPVAEAAVCRADGGPDPRASACLGDALTALDHAIGRTDPAWWPELLDPRDCARGGVGGTIHELRGALGNIDPTGAIAPDGARVAFAAGSELRALIAADGSTVRSDLLAGVTRVFGWSSDGRALTARAGDQVVRIDVASGARTSLPWTGDVRAVSDDDTLAARLDGDDLVVIDVEGHERARLVAPEDAAVAFEPGDRRAAVVGHDRGEWGLTTIELAQGSHARLPLRINGDAGASMAVAWSRPGQLVISGASSPRSDEALWRVELDDDDRITAPPTLLVPTRSNTIMDLLDVDGPRALVVMVDVPSHVLRLHRGKSTPLPGLLDQPVSGADAGAGRLLLHDERGASLVGTDGAVIAHVDRTDLGYPVQLDGGLWFAHADHGDVVLRDADLAAPHERRIAGHLPGPLDTMHCSAADPRRCYVSWYTDRLVHATLDDTGAALAPPFEIPIEERAVDLSGDGDHALAFDEHQIVDYDIRAGTMRVLHREPTCEITRAVWTPSATSFVYAARCDGQPTTLRLQPARPGAPARTLASFAAVISGVAVLADDDVVYSTIGYDSRLVLIDELP